MAGGIKDEKDRRLLGLLKSNARQPTAALAKQLGMARVTVHERIARLEAAGVIAGYTTLVRNEADSAPAQSVVLLSIAQRSQKSVVQQLRRLPEIALCLAISGDDDLMLLIKAPLNEDIDAVIDEINEIEGVTRSKTMMVLAQKFDARRAPEFNPRSS